MTLRYLLQHPFDILDASPTDAAAFIFLVVMAIYVVIYVYVLLFHT